MTFNEFLHQHFQQHPAIPFHEYMQLALYAPGMGYYNSALPKIGSKGDFITAPELSPLFGYTVANQCCQILQTVPSPHLFEYGAGSGALCCALLEHLAALNCLPDNYFILELSADLRQRQQHLIQEKIPHLAHRVSWLDRWPQNSFNGVILANEVLDAMPVHRFLQTEEELAESYIELDTNGHLRELFKPCSDTRLLEHVQQRLPPLASPYLSEANLFIDSWIASNYQLLGQGALLLFDYGFPRHEYYHPDRHQGTLMCHYQHHAHPDPLLHPGEQDITSHVDFTHVAEAGQEAGFHVAGYTNQASFLLANDILALVQQIENPREQIQAKQALKQLTHPSEMGELFKVIALTKMWTFV